MSKTDRKDYFKNYQRDRRAKSKAEHGNQPASAGKGFSERQLTQLSDLFDGMAQRLTETLRGDVFKMLTESPAKESDSVKSVTPVNKGGTVTVITVNDRAKNQKPVTTKGNLNSDIVTSVTITPRLCQQCGNRMDGKKPSAAYCSDKCRFLAVDQRRKAARKQAKDGKA